MLHVHDRTDDGVRQVDARDQLDRIGRHNADVLDALRAHGDAVIGAKGINFFKLARLSGLPLKRLRRVIECWQIDLIATYAN